MFFRKKKKSEPENKAMNYAIDWDTVKDIEDLKKILSHVQGFQHIYGTLSDLHQADLLKYTNARHLIGGYQHEQERITTTESTHSNPG